MTHVTYSREKDPKFFIFLERLENAAEFKELDRLNGRTALDDFVTGKKSIQFLKIVRQYEEMKTAFLKGLASGELNPHHDTDNDFDKFLQEKMSFIPQKQVNSLQLKANDREYVREKQIIEKVPNYNRGPKLDDQAEDQLKQSELRTVYQQVFDGDES